MGWNVFGSTWQDTLEVQRAYTCAQCAHVSGLGSDFSVGTPVTAIPANSKAMVIWGWEGKTNTDDEKKLIEFLVEDSDGVVLGSLTAGALHNYAHSLTQPLRVEQGRSVRVYPYYDNADASDNINIFIWYGVF